jgi:hypothetical protein
LEFKFHGQFFLQRLTSLSIAGLGAGLMIGLHFSSLDHK